MSTPHPIPPLPLTASIVLHHSDPGRLCDTLMSLDRAVRAAQEAALVAGSIASDAPSGTAMPQAMVLVAIVDQSLDAAYAQTTSDAVAHLPLTTLSPLWHRHARNDGYGAGHNVALSLLAATADSPNLESAGAYHLILNPDVELDADALTAGLSCLQAHPEAVLAAPMSRDGQGRREYLAKAHPSLRALFLRAFAPGWMKRWGDRELARYELRHLDDSPTPSPIVLASGACMLVRRQALAAVAGFDERYFLYFEDYDLSRRLAREGLLLQVPSMRVTHHGGGAARKGWRHIRWFARGGWRFFRRWGWRLW